MMAQHVLKSTWNQFNALALVLPILISTAAAIILVLYAIPRGFDITDESFYLLNAWNPADNIGAVSEFGKYLGVLTRLFGKDIVLLRQSGLVLLLFIAIAFYLISARKLETTNDGIEGVAVAATLIISFLAYYRLWIITPSYNLFCLIGCVTLALAGLIALGSAGSVGTEKNAFSSLRALALGIMVGVGGMIAAIGRPTTALAAGLITGLWLVILLRPRSWLLAGFGSVATFLTLATVHIYCFDGSLYSFVDRVGFAGRLAASLDAGHTMQSAFSRAVDAATELPGNLVRGAFLDGAVSALAIYLVMSVSFLTAGRLDQRIRSVSAMLGGLVVFSCISVKLADGEMIDKYFGRFGLHLNLLTLVFLLLALSFPSLLRQREDFSNKYVRERKHLRWGIVLILMFVTIALSISFGSNSDFVAGSGTALALYCLSAIGAIMLLLPAELRAARLVAFNVIALPICYGLFLAASHPYRLPEGLREQSETISFLGSEGTPRVDRATAEWVEGLKHIAIGSDWSVGTYLIDLTGASPGASVVLGARAPTTPWLVGGYKGSDAYLRMALSAAQPSTLRTAWILTAPEGVRKNDGSILAEIGIRFPAEYLRVGQIRSGYRNEEQVLWKPKAAAP